MKKWKNELHTITKYILSAGISFAIDIAIFTVVNGLMTAHLQDKAIIISTIIARIASSICNFLMNARFVFKRSNKASIAKYYLLVVIQMIISAYSVYGINKLFTGVHDSIIKLFVDGVLFCINYEVQKYYVFKSNHSEDRA